MVDAGNSNAKGFLGGQHSQESLRLLYEYHLHHS